MRRFPIEAFVTWDPDANAGTVDFGSAPSAGRELQTYPVSDSDGGVIAVVTFNPDGRLAQIELLDARRQLPTELSD